MALKCGIVGLPNVGKSTLFNCLSSAKAQAANFPFCTIEPNLGVITVPDERLNKLAEMFIQDESYLLPVRLSTSQDSLRVLQRVKDWVTSSLVISASVMLSFM